MSPSDLPRRRVLAGAASVAATALAGCAGDGQPTETSTDATTAPTTVATTEAATATEPTAEETTAEPVTDAERVAIAKRVTEELAGGEFHAVVGRFADQFEGQVSASAIADPWRQFAGDLGAYRGATVAQQGSSQGYPFVALRATFERGVLLVVVTFTGRDLAGLNFRPTDAAYEPPAYVDSEAFVERERTVPSPACDLDATLSLPDAAVDDGETVPGVVLVHGSGPNDRNQSFGPNRPFQDLAWGLASRGVAVLRYDKRTFACDVARSDGLDLDDLTVDDAVAAVDVLRGEDAVGPVAVVGHSLGGMAAPRIATAAETAGMASLAGPAGSLAALIEVQIEYLANVDGAVSDAERDRIEAVDAAVDRIQAGDLGDDEVVLGYHANFWRQLAAYDQTAVAADLDVPRFLAFAGRDYQVPVERERQPWADALADAGNATFRTYATANHLFLPGEGPSTPSEYLQPGNVLEALVDDLAAWTGRL
ncbi:alpha/beta fold hydrolase [Halorubellus litoreus]|uniref:Alpha/beta fold hydrolase n=1 Tax=Halorubellus litoreus TaxID=755308 RepID=A0ABD5VDB7_9EURY